MESRMNKITLSPEDLQVSSFETAASIAPSPDRMIGTDPTDPTDNSWCFVCPAYTE
jgi:hypothetical protein